MLAYPFEDSHRSNWKTVSEKLVVYAYHIRHNQFLAVSCILPFKMRMIVNLWYFGYRFRGFRRIKILREFHDFCLALRCITIPEALSCTQRRWCASASKIMNIGYRMGALRQLSLLLHINSMKAVFILILLIESLFSYSCDEDTEYSSKNLLGISLSYRLPWSLLWQICAIRLMIHATGNGFWEASRNWCCAYEAYTVMSHVLYDFDCWSPHALWTDNHALPRKFNNETALCMAYIYMIVHSRAMDSGRGSPALAF